jgi:hypothetical protein
MDIYATHLPLLTRVISLTPGSVLELGMGEYSSLVLHEMCKDRRLVSIEQDEQWFRRFAYLSEDQSHHEMYLFPDMDKADVVIRSTRWRVCFIDHHPAERRIIDAAKVVNVPAVVLHDSENPVYEPILRMFKYRFTYRRLTPWTSFLSNVWDLSGFL